MKFIKKIAAFTMSISALALSFGGIASAHVVVTPNQVVSAERTTFAVSVPNEHDTPVVGLRLVIPDGLTSVRPYAKQGWTIEVAKTGEGENASAKEIKWTSAGANVPVDLKDDFLFGAKAPNSATELKWKAYETYEDGTVVAWEQAPSESKDNKPYSVTKVMTETTQDAAIKKADQAAADAKTAASNSLYVGIAGVVLGLVGVFLATRKK